MYTIDISNDDIQLMLANANVWKSTAAVDPKLIGIVDTRLMAMKLAGVETPEYFNLSASNVPTDTLSADINMTNLATVVDGWGNAEGEDSFNLPWMADVKAQNGK
jgi:simple sugar transport system substrate-binding protein